MKSSLSFIRLPEPEREIHELPYFRALMLPCQLFRYFAQGSVVCTVPPLAVDFVYLSQLATNEGSETHTSRFERPLSPRCAVVTDLCVSLAMAVLTHQNSSSCLRSMSG